MTALVSGSSGYLGYNLTAKLVGRGEPVIAVVRPTSKTAHLADLGENVRIYIDDGSADGLASAFEGNDISVVYHLAACRPEYLGQEDTIETVDANIGFGTRLLHAAVRVGCPSFINTGSWWQFEETGAIAPNSLYAATKQAFQDILSFYVQTSGIRAVSLIPYDIYGPNDWRGRLTSVLLRAAKGELIKMTPGEQKMDIIHVSDVTEAYISACKLMDQRHIDGNGEHYFLGSGHRRSLKEIANIFEQAWESPLAINWGELPYRENQVFMPCPASPTLPTWRPQMSLDDGFKDLIQNDRLGKTAQ
ncbi:MAG: NAD(P)-dependent oxidoreductase [Rhodospirillaceae bacterium]|jgi:nucleoside-diphosphate-sugar epimerase|nr:NAD(P)-dependent oxidoreductase [Rhodospirillales bacterium]MBT3906158.1 NAD(P)-dependent oxidoreductase [Rhodospirillaceae bacterium]MBT4702465.1 NAD(P)-dependent oxidoreductase [Rhodospirillaceae bacterium]MBT5034816.1 NAD(P)-dependent oxidoreductase [Rhodospirillaceae bacterium]MBT6218537.1 NAD(P)-dependent oxidoreductase [Rhodospirillaceae bacterium]